MEDHSTEPDFRVITEIHGLIQRLITKLSGNLRLRVQIGFCELDVTVMHSYIDFDPKCLQMKNVSAGAQIIDLLKAKKSSTQPELSRCGRYLVGNSDIW